MNSRRGAPLLDVQSASVRFGGVQALDEVSCTVAEGEICGLIGPNGAGKTTLFNCITGVNSLASGAISFAGRRIDQFPARRIISLGIARTFQNVGLYLGMSVLDNVLLGTHHLNRHRFADAVVRPSAFDREEDELVAFCRGILRELELSAVEDQTVGSLPFGTLKQIEIARALASKPKLLLLDEPAAGLNHGELMEFGLLIDRLRKTFGLSVLLVEYNMGLVMDLCERLIVLHLGKRLAEGLPAEIKKDPTVIAAYLGETV
jgi:branched-chain amino acid transport system ATP-binding protein